MKGIPSLTRSQLVGKRPKFSLPTAPLLQSTALRLCQTSIISGWAFTTDFSHRSGNLKEGLNYHVYASAHDLAGSPGLHNDLCS